ncbi:MAG TPA: MOFRL family protein [Nannocystaceae bacterium]|nr:MOFRL family protein [Nannocystaceae bacterium]
MSLTSTLSTASRASALAAAPVLAGHDRVALVAFATDGDDGSSGAAGAVVDTTTAARAIDLDAAFARSDTAALLARLGDLVVTGPTGTNVCDLVVVVAR